MLQDSITTPRFMASHHSIITVIETPCATHLVNQPIFFHMLDGEMFDTGTMFVCNIHVSIRCYSLYCLAQFTRCPEFIHHLLHHIRKSSR